MPSVYTSAEEMERMYRAKRKAEERKSSGSYNPLNPHNEPTGHFTGRCSKCGPNDLWDDNLHYGCNTCKAFLA